ncbi:MAG TPA: ThuA domain-containing protein [Planctomycetota bacterium]|nr:ThuA domain-containing protein [Planctomycetota bacterium]
MRIACLPLLLVVLALPAAEPAFSVLAFSRTAGFRHGSIASGQRMLAELGGQHGFAVTASEDAALFTADALARHRVVVFLCTTGDVLDETQQRAFEAFIRAGNGFVGIHSATDTEYEWPWYAALVGGQFNGHPHNQDAVLTVVDRTHPSTAHLGETWKRHDEWYNFKNLDDRVTVLLTLDESTYQGGTNGAYHPACWYHEYDGGRAWYTAGGHTDESYAEPDFRAHVLGGIRWAAGVGEKSATGD